MSIRVAAMVSALALVPASLALAQSRPYVSQAYGEGLDRGVKAGEEDSRRGDSFAFADEGDYRSADAGYRSQYGPREWYRDEFRRGYEAGYRTGYSRFAPAPYQNDPWYGGNPRNPRNPSTPYDPRQPYGTPYQTDLAVANGYNDGYERGLDDGHDRRRFDPVGEGRYRSGNHGYDKQYGPKDVYQMRYREAFRSGYQRGYDDGKRYNGQRSWWPFN
jgi:hypothetical protein